MFILVPVYARDVTDATNGILMALAIAYQAYSHEFVSGRFAYAIEPYVVFNPFEVNDSEQFVNSLTGMNGVTDAPEDVLAE